MKKLIFPIISILLLASCASLKVSQDYDKTAPFSSYKTYQFTQEVANLPINEL